MNNSFIACTSSFMVRLSLLSRTPWLFFRSLQIGADLINQIYWKPERLNRRRIGDKKTFAAVILCRNPTAPLVGLYPIPTGLTLQHPKPPESRITIKDIPSSSQSAWSPFDRGSSRHD